MDDNIFSPEVPALLKEHLEHLKASAISIEVIKERGYLSVLGPRDKRLEEWGFTKTQRRSGIIMPVHGVDGKVINRILRADKPRSNDDGKPIKYEQPKGTQVRFDIPPRCLKNIDDPKVPIWIVEGVKKADALAAAGAECVIGETGVWGFRGKNDKGGKTVIADFERIAWNGRQVFIVYDSDMWTNRHVAAAFLDLKNLLIGKEATVRTVRLPEAKDGHKNGADDFLAEGHTLQDIKDLETPAEPKKVTRQNIKDFYTIDSTGYYFLKTDAHGGTIELPIANFVAKIVENTIIDDGDTQDTRFKVIGRLTENNENLPLVEVPAASFDSLSWVTTKWGTKAFVYAGTTRNTKELVLTNIKRGSREALYRKIYTHTGWREIDGEMVFLTAGGAIGKKDLTVELENKRLKRYNLTEPAGEISEAVRTSLDFLNIGALEITLPIWSLMYLAPLCEILFPSFTLWLYGRSGSFKSVISALALCHFGDFDEDNLPGNWHDTQNLLEKLSHQAKDLPFVIDDFAPGQDPTMARAIEAKAEWIIRAQGNHQGRGRMKADTSSQTDYYPRGLILVTGEQDPSGHSFNSRIISVRTDKDNINIELLTQAQKNRKLYSMAMAGYILWLKEQWKNLKDDKTGLKASFETYRNRAALNSQHPRIPGAVAWLYQGLEMGLTYAKEQGVLDDSIFNDTLDRGWEIICQWGAEQSQKTEEERPGFRFMKGIKALITSGRARLANKEDESPQIPVPGTVDIGWKDEGFILLNPDPAFAAVRDFFNHTGEYFTWKERAVWEDMKRLGYTECDKDRKDTTARIYSKTFRIIKVKMSAFDDF